MDEKLREVSAVFRLPGTYLSYESIQVGIVNRTYKVNFRLDDGKEKSFLVQNVNTYAFRNPIGLMNNIDLVTEHIRAKNPNKLALHFHHTQDRKTYWMDGSNFWRVMNYVPSTTYNASHDLRILCNAGRAFGEFQTQLADFDSHLLVETIPGFHNTRSRYESLDEAIQQDAAHRVSSAREEIAYIQSIRDRACLLTDLGREGKLPLRVTHNDTKLNNVLLDCKTRKALCVLDLDTVMPGSSLYDYGDSIRFGAATAPEDEKDLSKMGINLHLFRVYTAGYLAACKSLTPKERELLPLGAKTLTLELAVRFLTDYLDGDRYFKTAYPEHNLVRARAQMKLVADMEEKWEDMQKIVAEETAK